MHTSNANSFKLLLLALGVLLMATSFSVWAAPASPQIPKLRQEGDKLWAGGGYMVERDGIKVVHLKGTPMEIGMQQALLLSEEANRLRLLVDPTVQPHTGMDALIWKFNNFYMDTKLLPTFKRNIPERYIEEMEGFVYAISEGVDHDIVSVLSGNVMQELSLIMCTSVAAWGSASADGGLYHARNLDNNLFMELVQSAVVMVVEPKDRIPFITLNYPANMGVMHALNSKGISISMSYSFTNDSNLDGLPYTFMLREIAERAETLEQAVAIIKETPRTIGLNIMVGDAKIPKAVVVEVSADHYSVREATDDYISATNRYATEPMQQYQQPGWYSSALRDMRLAELYEQQRGQFTPAVMAEVLRDKFGPGTRPYNELIRGIESDSTMASLIFDGTRQLMWIGVQDPFAPASDRTMLAFSLSSALAGGEARQPDLDIQVSNPQDEHRLNWLALYQIDQLMQTGKWAEAQQSLEPLLARYPQSEHVLLLAAKTRMRQGANEEAANYFQRIVELSQITQLRNLQEATYYLGLLADKEGRRVDAISWYNRSLAVEVPDVGGDDYFRLQSQLGLLKPLGQPQSMLSSWRSAVVFTGTIEQAVVEPGGQIADISVLGAHRTQPDFILKWLGVEVGDQLAPDQTRTIRQALLALGAYDDVAVAAVPIGQDQVHLIIRLTEGFGFYRDPVELIVSTAVDLSQQTISLRYENIAGRAINVGGAYNWGSSQLRAFYIETPCRLIGPSQLKLQVQTRRVGYKVTEGKFMGSTETVGRQELQLSLKRVLHSDWTISLDGRIYQQDNKSVQATNGYIPVEGRFALITTNASHVTGNNANSRVFSLTSGVLYAPTTTPGIMSSQLLPLLSIAFNTKKAISRNMQVVLTSNAGWMDEDMPLLQQFWLGGSRTLRGYSQTIPTTTYAAAGLELRRYLSSSLSNWELV
jgi:tetratricopeptide (TPR) repeat protein/predicted choloylglycine hydrolase